MISVITCVNNFDEYIKNVRPEDAELIPIDNTDNKYSAAQALNIGVSNSSNDIIVCCHQDVVFPPGWTEKLYINIERARAASRNRVGVLGTAGVLSNGQKRGYMQDGNYGYWNDNGIRFGACQTVDESCLIFEKSSNLKFDEFFNHFHFYGADLCLQALTRGLTNFGIDAEIIHYSGGGESSMGDGRMVFEREMRKFKAKWIKMVPKIWTTTVVLSPQREAILADYIRRDR